MEAVGESGESADSEGREVCGEERPLHHPTYTEMMALDIADSTQVYTAFLVLLDLLEARNWKDVTYKGSEELQLVYLQGCPGEQEEMEVVVPMPVQMTLSHERVTIFLFSVKRNCQDKYWKHFLHFDSTVDLLSRRLLFSACYNMKQQH
ncbi:tRNA-splicing endonuclease subunit Sen15 isoform X2 [Scyliorhinus torazame]|uniref:tRNA-splicing endonuclease subunit Sen15 isoform X2 n=1 Tax=Scyliorhinus torazame TaxID=75743 RepID=UPI003B5BE5DF